VQNSGQTSSLNDLEEQLYGDRESAVKVIPRTEEGTEECAEG